VRAHTTDDVMWTKGHNSNSKIFNLCLCLSVFINKMLGNILQSLPVLPYKELMNIGNILICLNMYICMSWLHMVSLYILTALAWFPSVIQRTSLLCVQHFYEPNKTYANWTLVLFILWSWVRTTFIYVFVTIASTSRKFNVVCRMRCSVGTVLFILGSSVKNNFHLCNIVTLASTSSMFWWSYLFIIIACLLCKPYVVK
jgi:hypothetical protein